LPHRFSPLQRLDSTPHDRRTNYLFIPPIAIAYAAGNSLAAAESGLLNRYFKEETAPDVSLLDELPPFLYTAAI